MSKIKFIEFEYILGAHKWVCVQGSDWISYDLAHENYPWSLVPTFGMRYMQAWAVDNRDNISLAPGVDIINLLPPTNISGFVAQHGVVFYRIYVEEGHSLQATLTPISGDPDLYIWAPAGEFNYSDNFVGVETVAIEAQNTGTFQIEVHGYSNAEYELSFNATAAHLAQHFYRAKSAGPKPVPSAPAVSLNSVPQYFPDAPAAMSHQLYLPMTVR